MTQKQNVPSRNKLIDEMLLALRADIKYLDKKGSAQIYIKNGVFLKSLNEQFLYEFEMEYPQEIEEDTEVEVRLYKNGGQGKVFSIDVNTKTIQIIIDTYLGSTVAEAKLIISNNYLLKILCDRLEEVKSSRKNFSKLAENILFPAFFSYSTKDVNFPDYQINEHQKIAAQLALGSKVSYIWGPPGTGKTYTIAPIISTLVDANKSVLLISHTNVATDRALAQFFDKSKVNLEDPEKLGKFLRIGKLSPELKEYKEHIDPLIIAEKKTKPLLSEIILINSKVNKLNLKLTEIESNIKSIRKLDRLRESSTFEQRQLKKSEIASRKYKGQKQKDLESLARNKDILDKFQSANFLKKMLMGTNLEKIMSEKSQLLMRAEQNKKALLQENNKITEIKQKINSNVSQIKKLEKQLKNVDKLSLLEKGKKIVDKVDNLQDQVTAINKKLESIRAVVVEEAQLIATTLSKCYLDKNVLGRKYDCVILDEASMAPIPALYYAAGLSRERVVIVGDFCQLPPIAQYAVLNDESKTTEQLQEEQRLVNKWLKQDIFSFSQTTKSILDKKDVPWMKQLNTQYRMHPEIMNLINHLVYSNFGQKYCLTADDSIEDRSKKLLKSKPLPKSRVGIYVVDKKYSFPYRTKTGSYYNFYNALVATTLAQKAIDTGWQKIGIITPFRPQANLISQMISDAGLEKKVIADTVHKFQGEEKDIIIFDLTTHKRTRLTDDNQISGDDEKLLNVALSRAEAKCIVIADVEGVLKIHSQTSLFRKLINYCTEKRLPFINTSELIEGLIVTRKEEEWLEKFYNLEKISSEIKKGVFADQTNFYSKFVKDLLAAKSEVVIDSPFITRRRTEHFLQVFNFLVSRGVKIYILTRLPKDQQTLMEYEASSVLKELEQMGVIILPFKGYLHRKMAIIDREIFWNGSLNILSQRESQEIMIRTKGKETCDQILKFIEFYKNVGKTAGENKLERCDYCQEVGSWYWTDKGIYGTWTFCLTNGHKKGKPPIKREERIKKKKILQAKRKSKKEKTEEGVPICPDHEVVMIRKTGPWGEFWGCPHYPRCRITEKI